MQLKTASAYNRYQATQATNNRVQSQRALHSPSNRVHLLVSQPTCGSLCAPQHTARGACHKQAARRHQSNSYTGRPPVKPERMPQPSKACAAVTGAAQPALCTQPCKPSHMSHWPRLTALEPYISILEPTLPGARCSMLCTSNTPRPGKHTPPQVRAQPTHSFIAVHQVARCHESLQARPSIDLLHSEAFSFHLLHCARRARTSAWRMPACTTAAGTPALGAG